MDNIVGSKSPYTVERGEIRSISKLIKVQQHVVETPPDEFVCGSGASPAFQVAKDLRPDLDSQNVSVQSIEGQGNLNVKLLVGDDQHAKVVVSNQASREDALSIISFDFGQLDASETGKVRDFSHNVKNAVWSSSGETRFLAIENEDGWCSILNNNQGHLVGSMLSTPERP